VEASQSREVLGEAEELACSVVPQLTLRTCYGPIADSETRLRVTGDGVLWTRRLPIGSLAQGYKIVHAQKLS
jgi:hypothetical protein